MLDFATQSAIVAFGTNLFLTVYVLLNRRGWTRARNRSFSLLSLSFTLWNLGAAIKSPYFFYPGILLVPPSFYIFLLLTLRRYVRQDRKLIPIFWAITVLLISLYFILRPNLTRGYVLDAVYQILSFLYITPVAVWGGIQMIERLRFTGSRQERFQMGYMLFGMAAAGLAGITSLLPLFGIPFPSLGAVGGLIYTLSVTVLIMRHGLFDFGRLAGRVVVIFVLTFIFWCLMGILGNWYMEGQYTPIWAVLIASLVLVVLYEPLKALIEGQADRVLSRESFLFHQSLKNFSQTLESLVTEDEIIAALARTLRHSRRILSFGIYIIDESGRNIILRDGDDIKWPPGSVVDVPVIVIETLRKRMAPVKKQKIAEDLLRNRQNRIRSRGRIFYRMLLRFRAQIIFPFIFAEQFLGFLTLGFSDPETDLTHLEEETLTAVTRQFAAALSHARLVERERRKDRLAALGRMASGLAHEIRNPLGAIRAAVQFLEPSRLEAKDREFLVMIREEVDRLNRFVERFLNYARPVPVTGRVSRQCFGRLVDRIIMTFQTRESARGIALTSEVEEDVVRIEVPDDAWTQILSNLLDNAIQVLDGTGRIHVSAHLIKEEEGKKLEVTVEDSGPGISEQERHRVFQPFYSRREKGTGLGLAIVYRIVRSFDGHISVETSRWGGALFKIHQPLQPAPDDTTTEMSSAEEETGVSEGHESQ